MHIIHNTYEKLVVYVRVTYQLHTLDFTYSSTFHRGIFTYIINFYGYYTDGAID